MLYNYRNNLHNSTIEGAKNFRIKTKTKGYGVMCLAHYWNWNFNTRTSLL